MANSKVSDKKKDASWAGKTLQRWFRLPGVLLAKDAAGAKDWRMNALMGVYIGSRRFFCMLLTICGEWHRGGAECRMFGIYYVYGSVYVVNRARNNRTDSWWDTDGATSTMSREHPTLCALETIDERTYLLELFVVLGIMYISSSNQIRPNYLRACKFMRSSEGLKFEKRGILRSLCNIVIMMCISLQPNIYDW